MRVILFLGLLATSLIAAPAVFAKPLAATSEIARAPGIGDAGFVASFRCPNPVMSGEARLPQIKSFVHWVSRHHPKWTVKQLLNFRYALFELHDCTAVLKAIRRNFGQQDPGYPYVASTLLPRTAETKNCIRPKPETLPMHVVRVIQSLRDKAETKSAALLRLKKLAKNNNVIAEYYLATVFDPSLGMQETIVKKSWGKAIKWYLMSAKAGIAAGQISVGNAYAKGDGVPVDQEKAVHWYQLAARNGYIDAAWNMGVAYEYGRGIAPNVKKALSWYCAGAIEGDHRAQWHLAAVYYLGEGGVKRDLNKTAYWLSILKKEHDPGASILYRIIAKSS